MKIVRYIDCKHIENSLKYIQAEQNSVSHHQEENMDHSHHTYSGNLISGCGIINSLYSRKTTRHSKN